MRKSSRKAIKKTVPGKIPAAMLFFGVLAIVTLFTRGGISSVQPDIFGEKPPVGDVLENHKILDRGYRELAVSFKMKSLYARPPEITDIDKTAALLAGALHLDERKLALDLKSERSFVWLGRRLPEIRADAVLNKGVAGVYAVEESHRFYPARRSGAHVVGFLEENSGLAGVEFYYDNILRRSSGGMVATREIESGHLQLTLDLRIQKLLEDELGKLLLETDSPSGTGILMSLKTGAILSMVSLPDYDPNYYWDSSSVGRRNRAITGNVDIGAFQNLFGFAAAYDGAASDGQESLASLKMDLRLDSRPKLRHNNKWFERSGDIMLSQEFLVWPEETVAGYQQNDFAERFGLFRKTGIDLPGTGDNSLKQSGQTTPIKLLTAFAALVNGGVGVTPHLGGAVVAPFSGGRSQINHSQKPGLLKPSTSKKIVDLLVNSSRSDSEVLFMESLRPVALQADSITGKDDDDWQDRYQAMMIGFTPRKETGLALLIALDKAVVDSNKKTPMRSMGESVIDQMISLADEKVGYPGHEAMASSEKVIYKNWLESKVVKEKGLEAAAALEKHDVMPDLEGMSLRKALRNMQQIGLTIEVVGSGRVVAQEPKPGLIASGDGCLLTLQADI